MTKRNEKFKAAGAAAIGATQTPARPLNSPSPARSRIKTGLGMRGFEPFRRETFLEMDVRHLRDDYVCLSVAIPHDLVRGFVTFLESMGGLMSAADRYTERVMREARPVDLDEQKAKDQYREQFEVQIENIFNQYVAQGMAVRDAISATNKAMKARQHPWANYETIRRILSSRGALVGGGKRTSTRKKSKTLGNSATP